MFRHHHKGLGHKCRPDRFHSSCIALTSLQLSHHADTPTAPHEQARFIGSHNPAQVKRNVLASFTDVLLLPVTIVPRTTLAMGKAFGAALTTGGNAAVQGIAMLNPQRWGGSGTQWGGGNQNNNERDGYVDFEKSQNGAMVFDIGDDEEEDEEKRNEKVSFEEEKSQQRGARGARFCLSHPSLFLIRFLL